MLTAGLWGAVAFVLATCLTVLCIPLALRVGIVARPSQDRWHRTEIPLLGGIAIAIATAVPLLLATVSSGGDPQRVLALLLGAGAIAVVGLVDDAGAIRPQTKLIGQLLAATLAVGMGLRLSLTPSPELDMLLTVVWIVAFANAFNLLDNMDGLAAGIAAIVAAFRIVFFQIDGNFEGATSAAILLGATLGFLVHNRHPARIFMGDSGSMFLGFFVAGLSLVGGYPYARGALSILLLPVLLLVVPIFDTAFVTVTRLIAGRPVSVGGRDHTSHRLVALGLSEPGAVHVLYGIAAVSGAIAYFTYRFGLSRTAVLVLFLVLSVSMLAVYLSRAAAHHPVPEQRRPGVVRLLRDLSSMRQVAMVALDFVLVIAAYHGAYLLRFEGELGPMASRFLESVPIVVVCQLLALSAQRTYQGLWRYTTLVDLVRLVRASSLGTVLAVVCVVFVFRFEGHSRSVFLIDWLLLTAFLCGSRIGFRMLGEVLRRPASAARRVLIYGAGDGGEMAARRMANDPSLGCVAVGFVDDDQAKWARRIRGLPVFGGSEHVAQIVAAEAIEEILVASDSILEERLRAVAAACADRGVAVVRASRGLHAVRRHA
jgi:UDP-GlcNAc:undecaprenyl-phosphate GlcNAc-1-phosphate transferase